MAKPSSSDLTASRPKVAPQPVSEGAQYGQGSDARDQAGQHETLHEVGLAAQTPLDHLTEPLQPRFQFGGLAGQSAGEQGPQHQQGRRPPHGAG
jgi:hypothetical protein